MREAFQLSKLKAPDHRPPTLLQLNGDDDNDCGYYLGAGLRPRPMFIVFFNGFDDDENNYDGKNKTERP